MELRLPPATNEQEQRDDDQARGRAEAKAHRLRARRRRELRPVRRGLRRGGTARALEADLPQVALDDARDLELAARRERELVRCDRRLITAARRAAPDAALRVLARDRTGPPVADRIARLEVVLRRRRRAVLEPCL